MTNKLTILKLGGIGDIASTVHAIKKTKAKNPNLIHEINWITDFKFIEYIETLLKIHVPNIQYQVSGIESQSLFAKKGSTHLLRSFFRLVKLIYQSKFKNIYVFHYNKKYRILKFFAPFKKFHFLKNINNNEFKNYFQLLNSNDSFSKELLLSDASIVENHYRTQNIKIRLPLVVGIWIGGGSSEQVDFVEKRYPHWPDLIQKLNQNKKIRLIRLFGVPSEWDPKLNPILNEKKIVYEIGKFKLSEIPLELSKLDCFISIDTGASHIAALSMTKPHQTVITLFGPTGKNRWSPPGTQVYSISNEMECSPCYKDDGRFRPCPNSGEKFQICMKSILPDQIIHQIEAIYSDPDDKNEEPKYS